MVDSLLRHRRALISALALTMAVLLVVAFAPGASAGYAWNDMKGPGDGDARALLYDSAHSILYRGTANRGVWKYQAGVWMDTGGGLTGHTVLSLAYDSANNVLYAGTAGQGVWRCANPGTAPAWTATGGDTGAMHVNALLFIGTNLYAGTSGQGVWRCANPRAATPSWTYTNGPKDNDGHTPQRLQAHRRLPRV